MPRTGTDRLKLNPVLGSLPALQYLLPQQLKIDETYQRSIETSESQTLIRRIAQHWNWDLCQPLVVSRRDNGDLYVIDGQHRLAAANLRGDIQQLPAVVVGYANAADEAASFVHLNQQRRALTPLQIFHAAVASGDSTAAAIMAAIAEAGLVLGKSSQLETAMPGTINNVGGIQRAWRKAGARPASEGLQCLSTAFAGAKLIYAGTIYPGLVAVAAEEIERFGSFSSDRFARFTALLGVKGQLHWRKAVLRVKGDYPGLNFPKAAAKAIGDAWAKANLPAPAAPAPAPIARIGPAKTAAVPPPAGSFKPGLFKHADKAWCDQCDMMVSKQSGAACKSKHCSLKVKAAA